MSVTIKQAKQIKVSFSRDRGVQKSWTVTAPTAIFTPPLLAPRAFSAPIPAPVFVPTPAPVPAPAPTPVAIPTPIPTIFARSALTVTPIIPTPLPPVVTLPVTPTIFASSPPPAPPATAKAGCNCGAKKPPNGLPIMVNPSVDGVVQRVAGVGATPLIPTQKFVRQYPFPGSVAWRKNLPTKSPPPSVPLMPSAPLTPLTPPVEHGAATEAPLVQVLSTKEWGPSTWSYLHLQASYYPAKPTAEERERKLALFQSVMNNIPCHTCKREAVAWCEKHPLENAMHNGCKLSEWTLNFHNSVNKRLNRAEWSMEQMVKNLKLTTIPCQS